MDKVIDKYLNEGITEEFAREEFTTIQKSVKRLGGKATLDADEVMIHYKSVNTDVQIVKENGKYKTSIIKKLDDRKFSDDYDLDVLEQTLNDVINHM